jgi:glycosyltransferase involved in cell wall biosynthesis
MKISLCIITLNEETNLPRCLASSAPLVDEIVIVDSGSTDRTEAIARQYGAHWVPHQWLGYVRQKNLALSLASLPWVLSLDADEALSPRLAEEIRALKATEPPAEVAGYDMPRCVFYEGRWIRHGDWYPDRLVRLFRKDRARFTGGQVHERLEVQGEVRHLRGDIYHYSFKDAADHRARGEHYARLWAASQRAAGRTAGPLAPYYHAAFRWLRGYLLRAGFLDGPEGWRIAALCARETFLKYQWLRRNPPP